MKKTANNRQPVSLLFKKTTSLIKILLVTAFITSQITAKAYSQVTLTLNYTNVTFGQVVKEIEKQSNYRFYYSNDIIPSDKIVSINVKKAGIKQVMDVLLDGTSLQWQVIDATKIIISVLQKAN